MTSVGRYRGRGDEQFRNGLSVREKCRFLSDQTTQSKRGNVDEVKVFLSRTIHEKKRVRIKERMPN